MSGVLAQVLGVPVDTASRREVLARCEAFLRGDRLQHIITVNPEFVLAARGNPAVRRLAEKGSLRVPDGVGILWAARRAGSRLPERIPGVELLVDLCRIAARQAAPVLLLGGQGGAASKTAAMLRERVPSLRADAFARDHAADSPPSDLWTIMEQLRPGILFVAYGAPRQEQWIARHHNRLENAGVRIAVGVGGAFDILAGRLPRAPRWMRAAGLEWLWRLMLEPWRFPRIVRATVAFPIAVLCAKKHSARVE